MAPSHILRVPTSLLLLPSPPSRYDYHAVDRAYGFILSRAIQKVVNMKNESQRAAILEIALPCPILAGRLTTTRSRLFRPLQRLLAAVYKLVCIICARDSIDVKGVGGLDARIILIHPFPPLPPSMVEVGATSRALQGPIIDLATLARSGRSWDTIISVEGNDGEAILKTFLEIATGHNAAATLRWPIERVNVGDEGAEPEHSSSDVELEDDGADGDRHFTVAVGGTFDHLHVGHKLLLTMTMLLVEPSRVSETWKRRVVVGITGDELLKEKKFAEYLDSWNDRQKQVSEFVESISYLDVPGVSPKDRSLTKNDSQRRAVHTIFASDLTLECVEIGDAFGPTITDESITALVVSAETRGGGKAVNDKREEKGWRPLKVFEVDVLNTHGDDGEQSNEGSGQNFESKISSTELRRQESEKARAAHQAV